MGLSSSQARLLNLTTRMHQIEYKAAKLEAEKLQMANESAHAYEEYLDALETTKVQFKKLNTDGSVTYCDITNYDIEFIGAGYAIQYNGAVYDGSTVYRYKPDPQIYIDTTPINVTNQDIIDQKYIWAISGPGDYYRRITEDKYEHSGRVDMTPTVLDFARLCKDAFGADDTPTNVSEVITNLINSGDVTIVQKRKDGTFAQQCDEDFGDYETSVAINTGLREVQDESLLRKAEAQYEANMKKIDMKDRKFDQDLAALDAERNAVSSEMETLKKVANDNVDRTFKIFS